MVRHNVQNLPQIRLAQLRAEAIMRLGPAQFFIYSLVIDNIVSMQASRRSLQIRRAVDMRNPKLTQIARDPRRIIECKVFMELQPVGRAWNP
jgi:hypothetical protein